jgi:hypothetical protein
MNKLLKIKHWLLLAIIMFPAIITEILDLQGFWYLFGVIWCVYVYSFWVFSVGAKAYKADVSSRFKFRLFKVGFIYSLIYPLFIFYDSSLDPGPFPIWQVPFHLVGIFFMFYLIFFASRCLVQFEINLQMGKNDFFLTFCAFWFFPVGVFFVQPRVNQLLPLNIK